MKKIPSRPLNYTSNSIFSYVNVFFWTPFRTDITDLESKNSFTLVLEVQWYRSRLEHNRVISKNVQLNEKKINKGKM